MEEKESNRERKRERERVAWGRARVEGLGPERGKNRNRRIRWAIAIWPRMALCSRPPATLISYKYLGSHCTVYCIVLYRWRHSNLPLNKQLGEQRLVLTKNSVDLCHTLEAKALEGAEGTTSRQVIIILQCPSASLFYVSLVLYHFFRQVRL